MKKHLLFVVLIMALVLCFTGGVSAAITTSTDNPNQNDISGIQSYTNGYSDTDLWIGTLAQWKANSGAVQGTGTFFDNGEAINGDDIIVTNGVCGIVVAVGTRNPWGYPAGSVLDAGTVDCAAGAAMKTATGNRDMTWSIEPLVNGWDSWAPDNCGQVKFTIVDYNFDTNTEAASADSLKALKVYRIYNIGGVSFGVTTYYGIAPDQSYAHMYTTFKNTTGTDVGTATSKISNRIAVTNKGDDGGAMFGVSPYAVGSYAVSDEAEYFCGVYCPESTALGGSVGYKELKAATTYTKDQTKALSAYIVLSDTADFTALNALITEKQSVAAFTTVSGTTTPGGTVVVKKTAPNDKGVTTTTTYGWYKANATTGAFSFKIPQKVDGDNTTYSMFLETDGFADSATTTIVNTVAEDTDNTLTIGAEKKSMQLNVKDQDGNPIYAKVEVFEWSDADNAYVSAYPTVRFDGDSIYYTEAKDGESTGVVNFEVTPGKYKIVVYGEGYWFYSLPKEMTGDTSTGTTLSVTIDEEYSTPEGWLSADLHHHGNKSDAFSSPEIVIKSLAASGLDVGCMTDHDFTTNNEEMDSLASEYGLTGYIPSEEISCSWSHFNVLPLTTSGYTNFLDASQKNNIMNQFSSLQTFVDQTHQTGAAITANHPWISYGLFYANSVDGIVGGYTDDYDNIEINAAVTDRENLHAIISTTELWTSYQDGTALFQDSKGNDVVTEKAHYLVGGSDTHNVLYPGFASNANSSDGTGAYVGDTNTRGNGWYASGKARTFAYVGTEVTENTDTGYIENNALAFDQAVVDGNSYVSTGPVLDMDKIPGETYDVYENTGFEATINVESLYDNCSFYVLTKTGADALTAMGSVTKDSNDYMTYDAQATSISYYNYNDDTDTYEYHLRAAVGEEDTWVALLVIDANGNYAITNPWWVNVGSFSDVPDMCWYKEVLVEAYNLDIVNGYTDGTFNPQGQITRAEFAQMLYGLLNKYYDIDATNTKVSFSDVKSGAWYYNAVMYMAQRGYVSGYGDGTFKPNSYITRAEISQIIYGVAMANFKDTLNGGEEAYFTDVAKGAWYYKAIMTLADAGWVKGYTKDQAVTTSQSGENMMETHPYFLPETTATRAESVQFISRLFADFYNYYPAND